MFYGFQELSQNCSGLDEANIKSGQSPEVNNCTTLSTIGDDTLVTDSMGNSFEISHVKTIQQLAKAASTVDGKAENEI